MPASSSRVPTPRWSPPTVSTRGWRGCSSRGCELARQHDVAEGLDQRRFQLAMHAAQDVVGQLARHDRLVAAKFDQRGEDVGNREHANEIGNVGGTEPVRISAAVEIFM